MQSCRTSISTVQGYGVTQNCFEIFFSAAHCRLPVRKQEISVTCCPTIRPVHLISFPPTVEFSRTVCFQDGMQHCCATRSLTSDRQVWDDFAIQTVRTSEEDLPKAEQASQSCSPEHLYFKNCSFWIHTTWSVCQKISAVLINSNGGMSYEKV